MQENNLFMVRLWQGLNKRRWILLPMILCPLFFSKPNIFFCSSSSSGDATQPSRKFIKVTLLVLCLPMKVNKEVKLYRKKRSSSPYFHTLGLLNFKPFWSISWIRIRTRLCGFFRIEVRQRWRIRWGEKTSITRW